MLKLSKKLLSIGLITALVLIPFGAGVMAQSKQTKGPSDQEITTGKMAADLILVRPIGFLGTLFGSAVFIVGIPFSAIGGNTGDTFKKLVKEPAAYTFARPLGDI